MASRFSVAKPADDAELEAYGQVVAQVYNTTDEAIRRAWLARAGADNIRVVREGTAVVGGLVMIPMGQWFGGRSVPMNGVAAVAVLPEHRGGGGGGALMRAYVAEMRGAGVPISTLYPATQPLYRNAGYERAGGEYRVEAEANLLTGGDRALALRAETPDDAPAVEECYRRRARLSSGNLDRGAYIWNRIRNPLVGRISGYVVEGASGIEGCLRITTKENEDSPAFRLWCPDVVALTPAASRRIVGFLADHWSMTGQIAWRGSPSDPLLAVMREPHGAKVKFWNVWMLRVLDVAGAMTARGWAPGVAGEVHLDVTADEVLPENTGRWVVRVADGRAEVERGGGGTLRTDIRGLAAMYTGFHSPADLRAAGFADADDASLASATALFAGPHPWMADHF
jgi:predicted acetyltransferase